MPEFTALYDPRITSINGYRGGPYQQVASGQSNLNNDWYNGNQYQVYAFEYTPGAKGDVSWFIGQNPTWKIDARAIGPNGNIGQRVIPTEPMYPILNLGISPTFAFINWTYITPLLPATMRVDYIRIYQNPHDMSVTCDPEGYETTSYIANHPKPYTNPNLTEWYVMLA
jgi:beta-glucanase (GH16 family)